MSQTPKGWHYRGYLPHFDGGSICQFITCRLYDSLPANLINQWKVQIRRSNESEYRSELRKRVELYLDKGHGQCFLSDKRISDLVQSKIMEFHNLHYFLTAWVIMPNHIHLLIKPLPENDLSIILKKIKGSTAREANKILGREGRFWQKEYFDRFIRNEEHFFKVLNYIENNPVKAGLCRNSQNWSHSSANGWRKDNMIL